MAVDEHLDERLSGDGPELHGPRGEALGGLEEGRVLQPAARDRLADHRRLIGLHHLIENVTGPERAPAAARRTVDVAGDAAQTLDHVEEPRLAAHGEIEARVAVGDDVEPRHLLLSNQTRHRVQVLFAEARVPEGVLEAAAAQLLGEPVGARIRARDRGGQNRVSRRVQHRLLQAVFAPVSINPIQIFLGGNGTGREGVLARGIDADLRGEHGLPLGAGSRPPRQSKGRGRRPRYPG